MVNESDYFRENMSAEEQEKAMKDFVEACKKEHQQVPIWIRMQMDEEDIIPPSKDLQKALEDIDEEFGVKK